MGEYSKYNAQNVLENVNKCIAELENIGDDWNGKRIKRVGRHVSGSYYNRQSKDIYAFRIDEVYKELSIFDWWKETLSLKQLKQMQKFLKEAIDLGFKGYVCFNVGMSGCSHGMWAHKKESENGYSPDDEEILFHSFRNGDNYWSVCHKGVWDDYSDSRTLKEVKQILNDDCQTK